MSRPPPARLNNYDMSARFKHRGNQLYHDKQFFAAIVNYSQALWFVPSSFGESQLDSDFEDLFYMLRMNRAKAFFYSQHYGEAFVEIFSMSPLQFRTAPHALFAFKVAYRINAQVECEAVESVFRTRGIQLSEIKELEWDPNFDFQPRFELLEKLKCVDAVGSVSSTSLVKAADRCFYETQTVLAKPNNIAWLESNHRLEKDAVVMNVAPIAFATCFHNLCDHCGRGALTSEMCRTDTTVYCSAKCKNDAWYDYYQVISERRWDYDGLKNWCFETDNGSLIPILIVKLLASSLKRGMLTPLSLVSLSQLSTTKLVSMRLYQSYQQYQKLLELIRFSSRDQKHLDFMLFLYLSNLLLSNAYQVNTAGIAAPTGSALYSWPSFLRHSCEPNAAWMCQPQEHGSNFILSALRPILPHEALTISFVDPSLPAGEERSRELRELRINDCACTRCQPVSHSQ